MKKINEIKMFALDMDGTIYLENDLIDGATDFINKLIENNINYVFLTNNSSKNANDYLAKLKKLGIPCNEDNIFTSGMAMGEFLRKERVGKKVYLCGTKSLENELLSYGVSLVKEDADIVVVGFDMELNYQKLMKSCELIDNGAEFLATNMDLVCPIANKRYIPDCGSICKMITNATGKAPYYIGKPNSNMIDILSEKFNISLGNIAIVGDRIYTDIKTGINSGCVSILVMSGETTIDILNESDVKPDFVFDSIKDINKLL